jgi:hypothetical protein
MRPTIVSAANDGALDRAIEIAATATVDKMVSFLDTGFLPMNMRICCDGRALRRTCRDRLGRSWSNRQAPSRRHKRKVRA